MPAAWIYLHLWVSDGLLSCERADTVYLGIYNNKCACNTYRGEGGCIFIHRLIVVVAFYSVVRLWFEVVESRNAVVLVNVSFHS